MDWLAQPHLDKLTEYQAAVDIEPSLLTAGDGGEETLPSAQPEKETPPLRRCEPALSAMCHGPRRCMYCEDSAADEVEHFRPTDLYPEFVFAWMNYLYACGPCNVRKKNHASS